MTHNCFSPLKGWTIFKKCAKKVRQYCHPGPKDREEPACYAPSSAAKHNHPYGHHTMSTIRRSFLDIDPASPPSKKRTLSHYNLASRQKPTFFETVPRNIRRRRSENSLSSSGGSYPSLIIIGHDSYPDEQPTNEIAPLTDDSHDHPYPSPPSSRSTGSPTLSCIPLDQIHKAPPLPPPPLPTPTPSPSPSLTSTAVDHTSHTSLPHAPSPSPPFSDSDNQSLHWLADITAVFSHLSPDSKGTMRRPYVAPGERESAYPRIPFVDDGLHSIPFPDDLHTLPYTRDDHDMNLSTIRRPTTAGSSKRRRTASSTSPCPSLSNFPRPPTHLYGQPPFVPAPAASARPPYLSSHIHARSSPALPLCTVVKPKPWVEMNPNLPLEPPPPVYTGVRPPPSYGGRGAEKDAEKGYVGGYASEWFPHRASSTEGLRFTQRSPDCTGTGIVTSCFSATHTAPPPPPAASSSLRVARKDETTTPTPIPSRESSGLWLNRKPGPSRRPRTAAPMGGNSTYESESSKQQPYYPALQSLSPSPADHDVAASAGSGRDLRPKPHPRSLSLSAPRVGRQGCSEVVPALLVRPTQVKRRVSEAAMSVHVQGARGRFTGTANGNGGQRFETSGLRDQVAGEKSRKKHEYSEPRLHSETQRGAEPRSTPSQLCLPIMPS